MRTIFLFPVYVFTVVKEIIKSIVTIPEEDILCAKYCPFYSYGCCLDEDKRW